MRIVETMSGARLNVDSIKRFHWSRDGRTWYAVCSDDNEYALRDFDPDKIDRLVVPAEPGWRVIPSEDIEPVEGVAWPVLAWEVDDEARPVTFERIEGSYLLVAPDGRVIAPYDAQYANLEQYRAEWLSRQAVKKAV